MAAPSPLILICDHLGEGLSELLGPMSSVGYRIEHSNRFSTTLDRLARGPRPNVVVVDPLARGGSAELEEITRLTGPDEVPILLISDPASPLRAVHAARSLGNGPWDIVHRDAPIEEILLRIDRLGVLAEGKAELEEMRFRAVHDDRTELLRPVPFITRLREHFSAAQRHRLDMALVLADLDRFGRVNKEFDHTIGDKVIESVGRVIRQNLREEDVGGRLGGDEFGIVLPYTRRVDAARVVHRIRDEIRRLTGPIDTSGRELHVSASIGFETFDGNDLESVEELRRHAEVALRSAKEMGGHRAVYFRSLGGPVRAETAGE